MRRFEPGRVAAIVVGIERYDFKYPNLDLIGPGAHALDFVEVMNDAGVRRDQIYLFLSLREPESLNHRLAALGYERPVPKAGRDLEEFLTNRLGDVDCDLLYLYWCGHGAMVGSDRRLLYEDANDTLYHNLSVSELLQYLHSNRCAQSVQIGFLDACAERADLEERRLLAKTVLWAANENILRVDRSQFFYYAASPWHTAQSKEDVVYYSRAVLDVLRAAPACILQPNPDEWNQAIQDCFKRLWPLEASQFGPVSYVELVNGSERSTILVAGSRKASRKDLGKRELRLRLLDRVQNERVNPRLHQGLREAIRVELNLTELPGAINARLREYARLESEAFQDRPIESSVQEVFESGGGQLLILGEPGSGKTTLLLELAQELIQEARSSPESAIPIVFSLPRWQLRRNSSERARTLSEWIEEDLVEEYGTSRRAAANLVQQDRVLPLLDGLDEVEVSHRSACVDQIHEYQRGRNFGRLAVCCRVAEYASLPKLDLAKAIRLEKLSRKDVEREIAKPGLERVRQAMANDKELWEVVDTPLWLHVLFAGAQADMPNDAENQTPRDRLYARYVKYALERKTSSVGRVQIPRAAMLRHLGWVAKQMTASCQVEFASRDLDRFWLERPLGWLAFLLSRVAGDWLLAALLGGWEFGRAVGLSSMILETVVTLAWRLLLSRTRLAERGMAFRLFAILFGAATAGTVYALVGAIFPGHQPGIVFGSGLGLVAAATTATLLFVQDALLWIRGEKFVRSYRTYRSTYFYVVIPVAGLIASILLAKIFSAIILPKDLARLVFPLAVSWTASTTGSSWALPYFVRIVLWLRGLAPLRYAPFLNEATQRLFLIQRGDDYEFLHVTFRDYMAKAYGFK